MKKQIVLPLILSFWCCYSIHVNAQDNLWKKTLEQKYSDSGIEGDDPVLNQEIYYCYDSNNNLVVEMNPQSGFRIIYTYDAGRCTQKVKMQFDDFENTWYGVSLEEYTYYEDGNTKTRTFRNYDIDGQLPNAVTHTLYTYDDSGNLVKEEFKNIASGAVLNYTDYVYENERKILARSYTVSGSNTTLATELIYSYNANGTLSEMLTKTFRYTVDPDKLSNQEKEVYSYVNGLLTEMIVYTPQNKDNTLWNFSKKYSYKVDPVSKMVTSFTYAVAKNNMQTGEFLSWKQLTRTDYGYSGSLGADKVPYGLISRIKSGSVGLSWNTPASKAGLSGYKIYKDYALLTSVASGVNSYIDSQVKEGKTYDYFVQSVYNDSIQNISSIHSVKMIPETAPDLWEKTLEQKYNDSGIEGDDPVLNSETYYYYDAANQLVGMTTPEDNMRTSYRNDGLGRLAEEIVYGYDEEKDLWTGQTIRDYTYYDNGQLWKVAESYYGFDGDLQEGLSVLYLYNDNGELVKEETRTVSNQLVDYLAHDYESGLKISDKRYTVEQGQDDFLTEETVYKYSEDKQLAECITKSYQFTINPDGLSNLSRETYAYTGGLLTEKITYVVKVDNNEEWVNSGKYVYHFDPENKTLASSTYSYANIDMETGIFKAWKQILRTDFTFSDKLGENRTPKAFETSADGQGVHLLWNTPDDFAEGLSGYHIFKNYKLLKTVTADGQICKYDDANVKNNVVYDYFIQAVYNTNELMNITPVVSIKAVATNIKSINALILVSAIHDDIEIKGTDLKSVDVYTTDGTLVTSRKAESDHILVSVTNQGVYIVKVVTAAGEYRQKVVVK